MKIIYSCGPYRSCNYQVIEFLKEIGNGVKIKVGGYWLGSYGVKFVDWTLDMIRGNEKWRALIGDVDRWEPDLIISDGERIMAEVGRELGIEIWYCGGEWMLLGVEWKNRIERRYLSVLHSSRVRLENWPTGRKMIPSIFGDMGIGLREGYEWVRPYYPRIENIEIGERLREIEGSLIKREGWRLCGGEREVVAGLIYGGMGRICTAPDLGDIESIMNSRICVGLGIGDDVGDVKRMRGEGMELIERSRGKEIGNGGVIISKNKTIGEIINDII